MNVASERFRRRGLRATEVSTAFEGPYTGRASSAPFCANDYASLGCSGGQQKRSPLVMSESSSGKPILCQGTGARSGRRGGRGSTGRALDGAISATRLGAETLT